MKPVPPDTNQDCYPFDQDVAYLAKLCRSSVFMFVNGVNCQYIVGHIVYRMRTLTIGNNNTVIVAHE